MDSSEITLEAVSSVSQIAAADWDACANPVSEPNSLRELDTLASPNSSGESRIASASRYNPFVSHAFFSALEASGSACARTGWGPRHLVARLDGGIAGVVPCYLKSHSQGEYVFDRGWADAYERAGGRYYPKLQASVPFTPVTGRRLLVADSPHADERRRLLALAGAALGQKLGVSSLHVTFATESDWEILGGADYLKRNDQQYHFVNEGYADFDDFLTALASRKRKAIKRERRDALVGGIEVEHLTGSGLTEAAWDAFFQFYMDTGSRKWGRPYLNRRFFSLVGERMADRILLILAKRNGKPIAGALNFIGSETLYGRYWGAIDEQPFLHFELCYYQAIDWGIAHKLKCVEAGAQGEHKIARGYRPTTTYSAHWIAEPGFRRAVAQYLASERRQVASDHQALAELLPFKAEANPESE